MLRFGVVCMLVFTSTFPRAFSDHSDSHDHEHDESNNTNIGKTFDVGGNHGLNFYQAVTRFIDLENEKVNDFARNISQNDLGLLLDSLQNRISCGHEDDHDHDTEHHHDGENTHEHDEHDEETSCKKCLINETTIFSILALDPTQGTNSEGFTQVSSILLNSLLYFAHSCNRDQSNTTYDEILTNLISLNKTKPANVTWSEHDLEEILEEISHFYVPTTYSKCFSAHDFEEEEDHHDEEEDHDHHGEEEADHHGEEEEHHEEEEVRHTVEEISSLIITNLVLGRCIGEPTAIDSEEFTDGVFEKYGHGDQIIDEEEFEMLLTDLGILHSDDHGHDDHDDHGHEEEVTDGHEDEHVHRRKRAHEPGHEEEDGHDHEGDHDDHDEELSVNQCFSGEDLLDIYGIDHDAGIDRESFHELCPALIQQITSGACKEEDLHEEGSALSDLPAAQVWGYGFLAVFIISLCALAGIAVLPCLNSDIYEKALQMLIALAVATLSGDAILHLLPQAVGLHNHEVTTNGHDEHDHGNEDHGPLSAELAYVWKCLVAYLAIYMFFIFESGVEMCGGGHTHTHMEHNSLKLQNIRAEVAIDNPIMQGPTSRTSSTQELAKIDDADTHSHSHGCFGKGALPIMVILGDTLHNFGDGLAIGAAFSANGRAGLSTSIAVFCHELPHELGDFAVLLNAGLSYKMALLLNFVSALSAFVGMAVGIVISSANSAAREWIFAGAAGMFLYVSLVDMMPELIHHKGEKKSRWVLFLLQNIGFLIGATLILVIALYEDALVSSL